MIRLKADCASCVIESASSSMISLNGGQGYVLPSLNDELCSTAKARVEAAHEDSLTFRGVSLANVLIFSRTTEIPRSSDALSSKTRDRKRSGLDNQLPSVLVSSDVIAHPNSCRARARMVPIYISSDPSPGVPVVTVGTNELTRLSCPWRTVEEHMRQLHQSAHFPTARVTTAHSGAYIC
jgi:hypothetical protein